MGVPTYKVLSQIGPSNNPTFTVALFVQNKQICSDTGNKKSVAEQLCAKKALEIYKGKKLKKQNFPKGINKNTTNKKRKNNVNYNKKALIKNSANIFKKNQKNNGAK
ncbi:MAG TPA: hypothetical protein DDY82_01630 [Clostridiales bacterium]|nr:hypothetical protein [Clostridiales bacterium]